MLSFAPIGAVLVLVYLAVAVGIGRKRRIPLRRQILPFILFVYVLGVIAVTLFPLPVDPAAVRSLRSGFGVGNNLVPFRTIVGILSTGYVNAFLNVGGNVLLFVPFGFLLPLLYKRLNRAATIIPLGFAATLIVELSQFTISSLLGFTYRSFDVDDLILNTLGVIVGYSLLRVLQRVVQKRQSLRVSRRTWAVGLSCVGIIALAAFGGYAYAAHATPQKALESYDANVLPLQTIPFAKGVVLLTTTDPARFKQPGYVAWYMTRSFWGWRLTATSVTSMASSAQNDHVSFEPMAIDGETFVWGWAANAGVDQIVYRHKGTTYTCRVEHTGMWHLILPFSQSQFPHADWTLVLRDGSTAPLF